MAIYISQGRFTESAIKGMLNKPEDRAKAVSPLVEAAGGRLLHYFVTLGEYDFLLIVESEEENLQAMMASLFVAAGAGQITDVKSTVAITSADAVEVMAKAKQIAAKYRPPGG